MKLLAYLCVIGISLYFIQLAQAADGKDKLDKDQMAILQKAFDMFAKGKGYITPENVGTILRIMGQPFVEQTLRELIAKVNEDGSGQIQFEKLVTVASKFIVDEDTESL